MFFRFGYYNQIKMNRANYMDYKYSKDRWYKIDVLLDWDKKETAIFVDGVFLQKVAFYTSELIDCKLSFVDTLMLYNLTPGTTSSFKDIRLCSDLCDGTQESDFPLTTNARKQEQLNL